MTGVRVCLFLVCFCTCVSICIQAQIFNEGDYLSDYPPFYPPDNEEDTGYVKYQKPVVLRHHGGTDINLKCNTTSCHHHHKHKIVWEFKECHPDYKRIPCSTYYEISSRNQSTNKNFSWTRLPKEQMTRNKCSYNLHLKSIDEYSSGLYRCVVDNKTVKTYEVEVIDSPSRFSGPPPELLDVIPSNLTINQSMQIVIQCKVYSKHPPVIWWFKQSDGTHYDIHYSDKYYNRINQTVLVYPLPNRLHVYLSKLKIHHARKTDSGIYVCVAMTEGGKDYKDAVVNVIADPDNYEPPTTFLVLFLIPLILILIPIMGWLLWYYRKKKKNLSYRNAQDEVQLETPIIHNGVIPNESTFV